MAKILLIQPPQWYPVSPYLAIPLLAGQLKAGGFDVHSLDLNARFFNSILTKEHTRYCDAQAKKILNDLKDICEECDYDRLKSEGTYEEKTRYLKYTAIRSFYAEYGNEIPTVIESIEGAVKTLRTKADFFVPEKLTRAKHIIRLAIRLASMPYAPNELDFDNYYFNPAVNFDWENVKKQLEDKSVNMFEEYFEEFSSSIAVKDYDIITLSMTDLSQLLSVFTLTKKLRKKTKAKIILGGNYATQIYDSIMKYKDIFSDFIDYLVIGDGEIALTQLCSCLDGRCSLDEVPNLVYSDEKGEIKSTGFSCKRIDMNALAYADFSDYDMSLYLTPDPTFPVQLSKGCYWGKCSFCDYPYGQQNYCPKSIERIINEIKHLNNTYGATKFMFVDEAIPPKFYNQLALAIINEGLKINFYSFARLEEEYTPEVLKNLYNAGARLFLWGYECHSERIMKLMNKGINTDARLKILTDARKAGIWNNGLFMFGYPTETLEETKDTMDFIKRHRDVIPSCTLSNFSLKKNSRLIQNIGKNGVESYTSAGDFYIVYKDIIDGISQLERRKLRRDFQFSLLEENANTLWSVVFSDFDHLLLYLSEYGCDYVSSYRSDIRICPEFR